MKNKIITEHLSNYDYDVRKSGNARWIDQKCTYDVLSIVADCILEFVERESNNFTIKDIWFSEYSRTNVIDIFSKPDPSLKARHEFDKWFGQPIKLLAYGQILKEDRSKRPFMYSISNKVLLEFIALRELNALAFLHQYIEKVLEDSNLLATFLGFFENQTNNSYKDVREAFINFTIRYTQINKDVECGRIFTKVLNPLAFIYKKKGTKRGRLSDQIITLNDLQYNRLNWRDELDGKSKDITRKEHKSTTNKIKVQAMANYAINKAKRILKKFNEVYNNGKSEIIQRFEDVPATQIHHIFSESQFPMISDYIENLIALTPNQHFLMAHPKNNTYYTSEDFQYVCLLAKCASISDSFQKLKDKSIYNFEDYLHVLNSGLNTESFSGIADLDFKKVIDTIDLFFSKYNTPDNKYHGLIMENRPRYE